MSNVLMDVLAAQFQTSAAVQHVLLVTILLPILEKALLLAQTVCLTAEDVLMQLLALVVTLGTDSMPIKPDVYKDVTTLV